tara:strand:- start:2346 stop:2699 length:354 start_codon:yes stop_codon:yes gene_type:complete
MTWKMTGRMTGMVGCVSMAPVMVMSMAALMVVSMPPLTMATRRTIVQPKETGIANAKYLTIIDECKENLTKSTMKGWIVDYSRRCPGLESGDVEITKLTSKAQTADDTLVGIVEKLG